MSERSAYIANQLRLRGQRQCVDGYAVPFDSDLDIEAAEMIEALTPPPAGDTGEAFAAWIENLPREPNEALRGLYAQYRKAIEEGRLVTDIDARPSDAALRGRVAEEFAQLVENEMPATQDMADTRICDALARAAAAIRARTHTGGET